jgi:hypothetical protein
MSEFSVTAKFLFWVASCALTLSLAIPLGKLTLAMAEAAIMAQQHDQMSYGSFSRKLWSNSGKH